MSRQSLFLDIDLRVLKIWDALSEFLRPANAEERAVIADSLRAAYEQGYKDALAEGDGRLYTDNGYLPPAVRKALIHDDHPEENA